MDRYDIDLIDVDNVANSTCRICGHYSYGGGVCLPCAKKGIQTKPKNRNVSVEDMEIFRKMRLSGASIEDIAEKTKFSTETIRRRLHLMGLKILAHRCDRTTPERIQAMQDLRDQGIILKHIAARFNVDKMTVWRLTEPIKK